MKRFIRAGLLAGLLAILSLVLFCGCGKEQAAKKKPTVKPAAEKAAKMADAAKPASKMGEKKKPGAAEKASERKELVRKLGAQNKKKRIVAFQRLRNDIDPNDRAFAGLLVQIMKQFEMLEDIHGAMFIPPLLAQIDEPEGRAAIIDFCSKNNAFKNDNLPFNRFFFRDIIEGFVLYGDANEKIILLELLLKPIDSGSDIPIPVSSARMLARSIRNINDPKLKEKIDGLMKYSDKALAGKKDSPKAEFRDAGAETPTFSVLEHAMLKRLESVAALERQFHEETGDKYADSLSLLRKIQKEEIDPLKGLDQMKEVGFEFELKLKPKGAEKEPGWFATIWPVEDESGTLHAFYVDEKMDIFAVEGTGKPVFERPDKNYILRRASGD